MECQKAVVWTAFDDEGCRHMEKESYNWMLWNRVRLERRRTGRSGTMEMLVGESIVEIRDRMEIDVECFRAVIE